MKKLIGCSSGAYHDFSWERAIEGIAKSGFQYIEIGSITGYCEHVMPERMQKGDVARLKEQLSRAGLEAITILGHSDLTTGEGLDILKRRITLAKEMGIRLINAGPGTVNSAQKENTFYDHIAEIAAVCEASNIKVALETHGHLTPTGKDCLEAMKKINSPFIGINYDTANVIYHGGVRPEDDIENILDHIFIVHLKDKLTMEKKKLDFPPLGKGIIDFDRIFALLDESGYNGPFSADIELGEEESKDIQKIDEAVKASYEYLEKVAD